MPEGHTIHRIARDHGRWFAGQTLEISSPQGRFADGAKRLDGRVLTGIEAHGKHLFYRFEGRDPLHVHLGLYGRFRLHRNPPPEPRGAVRLRMIGDERSFDLNGPTACELMGPDRLEALCSRLGPDPLREDADPGRAWNRIRRSRAPIGTLLLDQSVIAGLGNIYRADILHRLGIHPDRVGREITREEFESIWELAVELLRIGVKYDRIITIDHAETRRPLSRLASRERLCIYKQDACPRCGGEPRSWKLAARTIWACDACQT